VRAASGHGSAVWSWIWEAAFVPSAMRPLPARLISVVDLRHGGDRRLIRLVPRLPVPRRRARAGGLHGADPSAPLDPTTSGTWPMMSSTVGWTTGKPLLDRGRDEMGHVGARFVAVLASFMALAIFYAVLLVLSAAAAREWDGRPSVLVTKRWPRLGGGLAVGWWLLGVLRMCQEDDE
jgi:hypothetical protein